MLIGSLIGGLVFFFATVFNKRGPRSPPRCTPPARACCWARSRTCSIVRYPGIAVQAVGLTFATTFVMLLRLRHRA